MRLFRRGTRAPYRKNELPRHFLKRSPEKVVAPARNVAPPELYERGWSRMLLDSVVVACTGK